ncbi:MAG: hypothetical protein V1821_04170 [bacterium]
MEAIKALSPKLLRHVVEVLVSDLRTYPHDPVISIGEEAHLELNKALQLSDEARLEIAALLEKLADDKELEALLAEEAAKSPALAPVAIKVMEGPKTSLQMLVDDGDEKAATKAQDAKRWEAKVRDRARRAAKKEKAAVPNKPGLQEAATPAANQDAEPAPEPEASPKEMSWAEKLHREELARRAAKQAKEAERQAAREAAAATATIEVETVDVETNPLTFLPKLGLKNGVLGTVLEFATHDDAISLALWVKNTLEELKPERRAKFLRILADGASKKFRSAELLRRFREISVPGPYLRRGAVKSIAHTISEATKKPPSFCLPEAEERKLIQLLIAANLVAGELAKPKTAPRPEPKKPKVVEAIWEDAQASQAANG